MQNINGMRYAGQEKLLGKQAQSRLRNMVVAIVGLGGVGGNSAILCTQLGVKKLILIDYDFVQMSNLSRQTLFSEKSIGKPKVSEAEKILERINPEVKIESHHEQLSEKTAEGLLQNADIILDCTDNFEARKAINRFCLKSKNPWIFSSALKFEAMLSTIIPEKTVCFECFASEPKAQLACSEAGIMNAATSLIASLQVQEMINLVCFKKPNFAGKLFYADLKTGIFSEKKLERKRNCPACSEK